MSSKPNTRSLRKGTRSFRRQNEKPKNWPMYIGIVVGSAVIVFCLALIVDYANSGSRSGKTTSKHKKKSSEIKKQEIKRPKRHTTKKIHTTEYKTLKGNLARGLALENVQKFREALECYEKLPGQVKKLRSVAGSNTEFAKIMTNLPWDKDLQKFGPIVIHFARKPIQYSDVLYNRLNNKIFLYTKGKWKNPPQNSGN